MYSIRLLIDYRPKGAIIAQSERVEDIEHLWVHGVNAVCWQAPLREIRHLSPETLEKRRKTRHNNRILKKMPLLAPLFIKT